MQSGSFVKEVEEIDYSAAPVEEKKQLVTTVEDQTSVDPGYVCLNCCTKLNRSNWRPSSQYDEEAADLGVTHTMDQRVLKEFPDAIMSVVDTAFDEEMADASENNPPFKIDSTHLPLPVVSEDYVAKALWAAFTHYELSIDMMLLLVSLAERTNRSTTERDLATCSPSTKLVAMTLLGFGRHYPAEEPLKSMQLTIHLVFLRQMTMTMLEPLKTPHKPSKADDRFPDPIASITSKFTDAHRLKPLASRWNVIESQMWRLWAQFVEPDDLARWVNQFAKVDFVSDQDFPGGAVQRIYLESIYCQVRGERFAFKVNHRFVPVDQRACTGSTMKQIAFKSPGWWIHRGKVFISKRMLPLVVQSIVLDYYPMMEKWIAANVKPFPRYLGESVIDTGSPYPIVLTTVEEMGIARAIYSSLVDGRFVDPSLLTDPSKKRPYVPLEQVLSDIESLPPCMRVLVQRAQLSPNSLQYNANRLDHPTRFFLFAFVLGVPVDPNELIKWTNLNYYGKEDLSTTIKHLAKKRIVPVSCDTMIKNQLCPFAGNCKGSQVAFIQIEEMYDVVKSHNSTLGDIAMDPVGKCRAFFDANKAHQQTQTKATHRHPLVYRANSINRRMHVKVEVEPPVV